PASRYRTGLVMLVALVGTAALSCAPAGAYFRGSGGGTAQAAVGSVSAPASASAQFVAGEVKLSWSHAQLASGGAVQGYVVTRSDGATVCGSAGDPVKTLSCSDASAGTAQSYTYTVA